MKTSVRSKLSIAGLILSILISVIFGFSMYKISYQMFFEDFLKNKLSLVKLLASSINGDIHERLNSLEAFNDPEYKRYLKYFRQVNKEVDYITWLGSVNYNKEDDTFYYCIDCDEIKSDTIWIESDKFSFQMIIDKDKKIVLILDEKEYKDKYVYKDNKNEYIISITEKAIFLNNIKILEVISFEPLTVMIERGELSSKKSGIKNKITYKLFDKNYDIYFTFSKKGDPASTPGELFIDSKETIDTLKKIIKEKKDFIEKKPVNTSYGMLLTAYSLIKNSNNNIIGIVCLDINTKQLELFNKKIFYAALIISLFTLIVIFILSLFLSQYIINPLKRLLSTVNQVSKGNYEAEINLKRKDEFGSLANHFNDMVHNIKESRNVLSKSNEAYFRFVPKDFLNFLEKSSVIDVKLGDQVQRDMTILFSDIRSFTTLSETMTPVENFNFVNSYLKRMGPIIRSNKGFIDKYIGDAIMALFPENPDDAVNAAVAMLLKLNEYNIEREKAGYKKINIGIGIHTGNLMLGTVGESERMDSTVISDSVNLASRLEGLTKLYYASIIISEISLNLLKSTNHLIRFVDKVQVVGKLKPINIYEIFDHAPEEIKNYKMESLENYKSALEDFFHKKFKESKEKFTNLCGKYPQDKLFSKYLIRCEELLIKGIKDENDFISTIEMK